MIETIGFLLFLLAVVFVAMGPRAPKDKRRDENDVNKKPPESSDN